MEDKKNKYTDLIIGFHNRNLMWYVLGSLISADSNGTEKELDHNIEIMEEIKEALSDMTENKDTRIPENDLAKYLKYTGKGLETLKNEKEQWKKVE